MIALGFYVASIVVMAIAACVSVKRAYAKGRRDECLAHIDRINARLRENQFVLDMARASKDHPHAIN